MDKLKLKSWRALPPSSRPLQGRARLLLLPPCLPVKQEIAPQLNESWYPEVQSDYRRFATRR